MADDAVPAALACASDLLDAARRHRKPAKFRAAAFDIGRRHRRPGFRVECRVSRHSDSVCIDFPDARGLRAEASCRPPCNNGHALYELALTVDGARATCCGRVWQLVGTDELDRSRSPGSAATNLLAAFLPFVRFREALVARFPEAATAACTFRLLGVQTTFAPWETLHAAAATIQRRFRRSLADVQST